MKVFLETYGCQMNEYDSELIRSILTKANYSFVKTESDADIIMLNTCAIRENAHRKVYGRIHDIRNNRRKRFNLPKKPDGLRGHDELNGPGAPLIGILGCMATNLRKELFENKTLKIDFIAGPDSYKKLPDLIREAQGGEKAFDATLSEFETYSDVFPKQQAEGSLLTRKITAWLAVSRGCNNFCTFCVVPYTRGRERSRTVVNVVEEAQRLAADGFKQITLLGQNVNSYRDGEKDFADLLDAVSQVEGILRIRFTSPHPKDFPEHLLKVVAQNPKVCKHVHMPLQAANDRILGLMDRTYTQKEFLELVDKTRSLIPGVSLTTDIIVGFPTETDAEFEDTVKLMKHVEFDSAFIFKYSQRQGTLAQRKYPDDIPDAIKTERIVRLNEIQKEITLKRNKERIGKFFDILIEENTVTQSQAQSQGRTDGNQLVIIEGASLPVGQVYPIKIASATPHALKGHVPASIFHPCMKD